MSLLTRLECNYLAAPCGIAVEPPTLSWQGVAARLRIFDDAKSLVFDSQTPVASPYIPAWTPAPQSHYTWELTADNAAAASEFESAFPDDFDWSPACWLNNPYNPDKVKAPTSIFRTAFTVDEIPARARLYASAMGVYSARLNGKPVTDAVLMPGAPDFYTRTLYQTYPVEKLLKKGRNELEFEVASGWHSGAISRVGEHYSRPFFVTSDALIARLEVWRTVPGKPAVLTSSTGAWQTFCDGPRTFSDLYMGEAYDATKRPTQAADITSEVNYDFVKLDARNGAPIRRMLELEPVKITPHGEATIVDFGQNFAGRERITFTAPRGTEVTVRHGEMLHADGALYVENLRAAEATTHIIAPGGTFTFEPEFTFYGFRYLEVRGVKEFTVKAEVLYSDIAAASEFHSSNALLNRFVQNVLWGQRSNFLDIPTDCPQRDERRGWSGDAQVFAPTALYQMHTAAFFRKWLADLRSCADPNGRFPVFAPNYRYGALQHMFGVSGWSDAGEVIPAACYLFYGDRRFLEENAEAIYRWIDWQAADAPNGLAKHARFKDWLNLNDATSEEFLSTAYFAHGAEIAERVARTLGDAVTAERMNAHYRLARKAFRTNFVGADGELAERTQCAAAMALGFGLLEEAEIPKAYALLKANLTAHGGHLATGFLGTPLLLFALSNQGDVEGAYRLLEETGYPSWLYPVTQGATTIWERWNSWSEKDGFGDIGMNSFNHYAYGAAAEWIYAVAAGIRPVWETPGFREFVLAPRPGGSLTELSLAFDSPAGKIVSAWKRANGKTIYEFVVPEGTQASLELFGEAPQKLTPGHYRLER